MTDAFDFTSLTVQEIPFKIRNKDGSISQYILREASGGAATKYNNAVVDCQVRNEQGKLVAFKDIASVEPLLVSLCAFQVTAEGEKPVPLATVESWPNRIQKQLFEAAKTISDIVETLPRERAGLAKALALPTSPLSLPQFRDFLDSLNVEKDEELAALKRWVAPTPEERAKNVPSDTTTGSS